MARFSLNDFRRSQSQALRAIGAILCAAASVAVVVALLIVLLPLLGLIIVVASGIVLGACLTGALWWLLRGRKLWRQFHEALDEQSPPTPSGDRPRKKIKSKVHKSQ